MQGTVRPLALTFVVVSEVAMAGAVAPAEVAPRYPAEVQELPNGGPNGAANPAVRPLEMQALPNGDAFATALPYVQSSAAREGITFQTIRYQGIRLNVPRQWVYEDEAFRRALQAATDRFLELHELPRPAAQNDVVIAGHSPDGAATMRLSVRQMKTFTQAEMRANATGPSLELAKQAMRPVLDQTVAALTKAGASDVIIRESTVWSNGRVTCYYTDVGFERGRELRYIATWICPAGNRNVKLSLGGLSLTNTKHEYVRWMWDSLVID